MTVREKLEAMDLSSQSRNRGCQLKLLSLLRPLLKLSSPTGPNRNRVLSGSQLRCLACVARRMRLGGLGTDAVVLQRRPGRPLFETWRRWMSRPHGRRDRPRQAEVAVVVFESGRARTVAW